MAGLLVSVRSAAEAETALGAGACVIDVKEPARGPLGCADPAVWRLVVEVVGSRAPVSVALGEITEWETRAGLDESAWAGILWRKIGLAGVGDDLDWARRWKSVRARMAGLAGWIAVVYADHEVARAPHPDAVVEAAIEAGCAGVLIDTWDKRGPGRDLLDRAWLRRIAQARGAGLRVALAGGLDAVAIRRMAALKPDLFAVRGAACRDGQRDSVVDADRVAALAAAAGGG